MTDILLVDCEQALAAADTAGALIVATTATGMAACEMRGLDYRRLDEWCAPGDIEDLGWRNYRALNDCCDAWDEKATALLPQAASRGIRIFRFSYYQIKIAMDAISVKLLCLLRMIEAEKPGRLIYAASHPGPGDGCPAFTPDTHLCAEILDVLPVAPGCEIHHVPLVRRAPRVRPGLRNLAGRLKRRAWNFRKSKKPGRHLLLFDTGHDIENFLPALARAGLHPIRPRRPAPPKARATKPVLQALGEARRGARIFEVDGVSYEPLMETFLFEPLAAWLPTAFAAFDEIAGQAKHRGIRFCLTASIGLGLIPRSQMEAARQNGAPLITVQEGGGYGSMITPIYDYIEAVDGDLMLTYGPGNAEYYRENGLPTKPLVAVGSSHQEKVRAQLKAAAIYDRPFTVLYVGTGVGANIMHCPNNGLMDTYYFGQQMRIFDTLARLPAAVRVLARLHPVDRASATLLALPRYGRIVREDRRFEDALHEADVIVMDFPSTVLLSACLSDADILVLASPGVAGLTRTQAERLRTRAELFTDLDAFCETLAGLRPETARPRLRGDDYLRAYALPDTDDSAIARAVSVLSGIAETGELPVS